MPVPRITRQFKDKEELLAAELNDRFTELQRLLRGNLTNDNVDVLSASSITGTAATLNVASEQDVARETTFSGLLRIRDRIVLDVQNLAAATATPSVAGGCLFRTQNTVAQQINNFTGGIQDQIIIVEIDEVFTKISGHLNAAAGSIVTDNALDYVNTGAGAGEYRTRVVAFINDGGPSGTWYELFKGSTQ